MVAHACNPIILKTKAEWTAYQGSLTPFSAITKGLALWWKCPPTPNPDKVSV